MTKLNEERVELVKKTEEKLAERKIALQRSEDMLLKAQAKREKIISVMNRPKKEPVVKLTPEERAAKRRESLAKAREAKKAEREKLNALLAAIEESGKSVDEIVAGNEGVNRIGVCGRSHVSAADPFCMREKSRFPLQGKIKSEERFASGIAPVYGINRRL